MNLMDFFMLLDLVDYYDANVFSIQRRIDGCVT